MKTKIHKTGDTVVITVDGKLDFEAQEPFRQDMTKLVSQVKTDTSPRKIIFNMEKLEFVGSSGISAFVQTLKDVNSRAPMKPRYCNVRSEFRRIMKAFDEEDLFEFFESEERAKKSFDQ
jgi:anti-anti-sigma factor